jgi:putative tryptophan/tyrosine transport system substrate-binding protein
MTDKHGSDGLLRRRDVLGMLALGALVETRTANAQQGLPTIGFLSTRSASDTGDLLAALTRGLAETGHVEGRTLRIEFRWASGAYDLLPGMAGDLVDRRVAVLVATGGPPAALAAKAATSTTPIVFLTGGDPILMGLIRSHNRPGGNATGIRLVGAETLESKRLALLGELLPQASRLGFVVNPNFPPFPFQVEDARSAERGSGVSVEILQASTEREIEVAFEKAAERQIAGLAVAGDPFFTSVASTFIKLAARHRIPAIYEPRAFANDGGLASYGPNFKEVWRQLGVYTGRILNGATPSDLPVLSPLQFDLVINLKTAKALGLTIPPALLARADQVIE